MDTYQLVRNKVKKNEYGKRSVVTEYLLRGKVKCGYCGMPISAETGTTRQGVVIHYYKCLGKKKYNNGCVKSQIRKTFLEEFVLNCVIEQLSKPKIIDYVTQNLMKIQNEKATNQALSVLLKEKSKVDKSLNNIADANLNVIFLCFLVDFRCVENKEIKQKSFPGATSVVAERRRKYFGGKKDERVSKRYFRWRYGYLGRECATHGRSDCLVCY